MASRRLAISSLLCDEPQPRDPTPSPDSAESKSHQQQFPTPPQPAFHHHRSPSPTPISQPASPTRTAFSDSDRGRTRYSYTTQKYVNYPSPASPVHPYPHRTSASPYELPSPSHSAPVKNYYSASPPRPSLSPTAVFQPHPVHSGGVMPYPTSVPRPSPISISTSLSSSISLSPAVSQASPYSGLDALVQAATEERERIGGDRRSSGGSGHGDDRDRFPSSFGARGSASPVIHRSDTLFRRPSPSLPSHHLPFSSYTPDRTHYTECGDVNSHAEVDNQPSKSRRTVPDSFKREHDVEAAHANLASQSFPPKHASAHPNSFFHSRPQLQIPPRTSPSPMSAPAAISMPAPLSMLMPMSSSLPTHPHGRQVSPHSGRRSPPRSKLKTKRLPGSAGSGVGEGEQRRATAESVMSVSGIIMNNVRQGQGQQLSDVESEARPQPMTVEAKSSKKEEEEEEQDVHDFFLSTFDTPRRNDTTKPKSKAKVNMEDKDASSSKVNSGKMVSYSPALPSQPRVEASTNVHSKTSTPLRALERELGLTYETAGVSMSPDVDIGMDADMEGSQAAAVSSEGDAMEVDVEDELLSLVDDHLPGSSTGRAPAYAEPSIKSSVSSGSAHGSMPPPPTGKAGKTKATFRAGSVGAVAKSGKVGKSDGAEAKPEKPKRPAKPRGKPGTGTSAKSKGGTKQIKDNDKGESGPPASSHPSLPTPPAPGEAFPNVTSSGRMVTKTKKSAAATGTGATARGPSSSHSHSASPFPIPAAPTAQGGKRKMPGLGTALESNEARSRSHSVMARDSVGPEAHQKGDVEDAGGTDDVADDKLYCVCKTRYDEDRVMIACDRCDEWYHTQCVNMPDLEVDLVDQFICPPCVARNPDLPIHTTYKPRCYTGIMHAQPASADACHKPARGAFSKYCSDECGVRYMQSKIQTWASNGGDVGRLWQSVKGAKRREGIVVREPGRILPQALETEIKNELLVTSLEDETDSGKTTVLLNGMKPSSDAKVKRETERLQVQLAAIVRDREDRKKEMEAVLWRERLLELAMERAGRLVDECGWDQRLCFGDEEWAEFGEGVFESYDEGAGQGEVEAMQVDGQPEDGEWWCRGKKKCERHAGWQKLRAAEVTFEKEMKEAALAKLTTREREVRKRIEDILEPQAHTSGAIQAYKTPLKPRLSKSGINGTSARRPTDRGVKKEKKKRSMS